MAPRLTSEADVHGHSFEAAPRRMTVIRRQRRRHRKRTLILPTLCAAAQSVVTWSLQGLPHSERCSNPPAQTEQAEQARAQQRNRGGFRNRDTQL